MLVALALVACTGSEIGATPNHPADSPAATFDVASSALTEKTVQHGQAVGEINNRTAMMKTEDEFWSMGQADWDTMNTCMDSFQGCGMGMMAQDSWNDWSDWMGEVSDAMQSHHDEMGACGTVDDCHGQEADWQQHMSEMFDRMDDMSPAWQEDCHW